MDIDRLMAQAEKWSGIRGYSKTTYFAPDEDAPLGRYWDGEKISEHPSQDEISRQWSFWVALAAHDQKETLQGMFDLKMAKEFEKLVKGKDAVTIVDEAIKFWAKVYPHEVREFMAYVKTKRETLINVMGWTPDKLMKYKGAIPQKVKGLVTLVEPELMRLDVNGQSRFDKLFYENFTKAQIGGN